MRVERGTAQLATMYANAHREKGAAGYHLHDFAPYHDMPELTLEEAMKTWG